jgi:hypothetical protein
MIASAIMTVGISIPANAAITFLDHFNGQTSFTLNPAEGDYAGGSGTAVTTGSPTTDTGFFGAGDLAYHSTNAGQYVDFANPPPLPYTTGNIQYTSDNSGGFTVGTWFKMAGSYEAGDVFTLGYPSGDDHLELSYGESTQSTPRVVYANSGLSSSILSTSSQVVADATHWIYVAVTVDLDNAQMSMYAFDSAGTLKSSTTSPISLTTMNGFNLRENGKVEIGNFQDYPQTTDVWVDELSIDDQVLSQAAIQARVDSMVGPNGHELAIPEPAALSLLGLSGLMLVRRKRKA